MSSSFRFSIDCGCRRTKSAESVGLCPLPIHVKSSMFSASFEQAGKRPAAVDILSLCLKFDTDAIVALWR